MARKYFIIGAIVVFFLVVCTSSSPVADHDHGDHDHDHHHHDHDDTVNKVDTDGPLCKDSKDGKGCDSTNHTHHDHDHHDEKDHHNVHHMSQGLENLWGRWEALESAVCGPKPDQAHFLIHRHDMKLGDNNGTWRVGSYFKSKVSTKSEDLGTLERSIYSGGPFLLEGDAFVPWFRMTKSAVLLFWHKGANLLVHVIAENGDHKEHVIGDELTENKDVHYSAVFPPNTWLAIEIEGPDDGQYAFFTSVLVPGWARDYDEAGKAEDLVALAGAEHKTMIERLVRGAKREAHDDHHHGHGHDHHHEDDHHHHHDGSDGHKDDEHADH